MLLQEKKVKRLFGCEVTMGQQMIERVTKRNHHHQHRRIKSVLNNCWLIDITVHGY